MKICPALLVACVLLPLSAPALTHDGPPPDRKVTYKEDPKGDLQLHIFEPEGLKTTDQRPAIVFFFGGGWNSGSPSQFYPFAKHLAEQGMVAIAADYRTKKSHGTSPVECVKDGKSAVRWIRQHATELGIDPARIAAGGGSAGGHVAAATAHSPGFEEEGEDHSVSSRPDALVLFNPVLDNGPGEYGHGRVKKIWKAFSPAHNVRKGAPPAVLFLGTKDNLIPVATLERYKEKMEKAGTRCELHLYEGQAHGFFNKGRGDSYPKILTQMDAFLRDLGYLE